MPPVPQDPTPRLTKLDKQLSSRQRVEDRIVLKVINNMKDQSEDLFNRIQRRIARLDLDGSGNIKRTNKNLKAVNDINALIQQGGDLIAKDAIREFRAQTSQLKGFYSKEILSVQADLGGDSIARIIGSTQTNALLNVNLDNLRTVSASFTQEVRRQLESTLFENVGPEEMSKRLAKQLLGTKDKRGNPMTRHADTIAKTAYNAYANALTLQNVNLEDVVAYYYSGPKDNKNRSFCAVRVEKVHEKEQLQMDIGGQAGGTLHNAGGFNCRHKLFPISKFDEEAKPFLSSSEITEIFGNEE